MEPSEIPGVLALPREAEPPAALEDRVADALRARGLVKMPPRRVWIWRAAAAMVLLACGFALGHRPARTQPTFVLLLRQGSEWRTYASDEEQQRRVAEYRTWAQALRARGIAIDGIKLQSAVEMLPGGKVDEDAKIAGFFSVNAKSLEDALEIARSCPHLRYGGVVEVRQVERV